jgi:hypothetical protein
MIDHKLINKIIFNIINSKAQEAKTQLQQDIGGIGLKNVKTMKRLQQLLYIFSLTFT